MDSLSDFYDPPVCPECGRILNVSKSREEAGIEYTRFCNSCGYEESNLVRQ